MAGNFTVLLQYHTHNRPETYKYGWQLLILVVVYCLLATAINYTLESHLSRVFSQSDTVKHPRQQLL